MREFSTSISNALANGLKPDEAFRDTMFFKDLYNLIPSKTRLRAYQPIVDVLPLLQEKRNEIYPFPQWFRLEHDNIVISKKALYKLEEYNIPPFDLSPISTTSPLNFSESFRHADYGNNWMMLNRDGCIYKYNDEVDFTTKLKASAITHHQNRTVIGGPLNGLWADEFLEELERLVDLSELEKSGFNLELKKNYIFWSGYDSNYFPFSLLFPELVFSDFTNQQPFTELLYSNSFGYMEMPFKGDVLDMISSNGQVFVFGSDGICSVAISPKASGATFHITGSQPFGIKQRGAVGGDENSLVFIDVFDQLWYVTNRGLEKLNYSEYMKQLGENIWITKDPEQELFYIGDLDKSFALSNGRLTRIYQTVHQTSGAFPFRAGVMTETGDKKASFKSDKLDLGNTDNKTLTGVAVGLDTKTEGTAIATATIDGREFSIEPISLNPDGYAATRIYGKQHIVEVILNNFEGINIDHIELKWQIDDRRQRRGTFTTQNSSGAG